MKKCALVALATLFASFAYAATPQPVPVYTFVCKGNPNLRIGTCAQGGRPDALIQGSDGNFYGAAQDSQEGSSAPNGGTTFSLTSTGTLKVLHVFSEGPNKNFPNGNLPGLLTQGPDGKIYGETIYGGNHGCNGYCGYGVLYRINTDGSGFKVIHKYCAETNCTDGEYGGKLVVGTDGNVYGTAYYGGANNGGVLFQVTPSTGAYKVVVNFNFSTTGEFPSGLIVAPDGTFYGTTSGSQGTTLFHYTESTGTLNTYPVYFPQFNGLPSSGSVSAFGPDGNLYGIYVIYGTSGIGLFEVNPDGSNLQLFPFFNTIDGGGSPQGMLLATDGNFWIPMFNGSTGYGSIVTISPTDGSLLQTLSPFSASGPVGAYPLDLIQASDGTLWGSTDDYGKAPQHYFGDGTVFSLNAGLPPLR
jgi:uncharacterized repeat protein (TIGR03803 family)